MKPQSAREAAEELVGEGAFGELPAAQIRQELEHAALGEALGKEEFNALVIRGRAAREIVPRRLGTVLPRVVGVLAVLMGAVWIVSTAGKIAFILGLILIIKPAWRDDEIT